MKGKKCALKKTTGPSCFPSIFATKKKRKKKSDVPSKRYRMFVRKSVFCTWDIPIVLYVRYQNALFGAHEMSRYAAGTSVYMCHGESRAVPVRSQLAIES